MNDQWMHAALGLAEQAYQCGEVPVGAVVVMNDEIIGRGYNRMVTNCDPTAHAEIAALRDAATRMGNYRLPGSTLYVTVEPCTMCAGALVHARVARLFYGAAEPRAGAVCSSASVLENPGLNHRVEVEGGILAAQCGDIMTRFFRERRNSW